MPRYFFDVKNGHRLIDPSGLECRNDRDAYAKAVVIAQQIAQDSPASVGRHVAVLDSERQEVSRVDIVIGGRQRAQEGAEEATPLEAPQGDGLDEVR
jgi:hypothetical protein